MPHTESKLSGVSRREQLHEQLEFLRMEREELLMRHEIPLIRSEIAAMGQSRDFYEAWGDLVNPLEHLWDSPDFMPASGRAVPWSQRGDRAHGANRPVYETEAELASIRGMGRLLYDAYPVAKCAMRNLQGFILGTGSTCKITSKKKGTQLAKDAQESIDDFHKRVKWYARMEREVFARSRRDGEVFLLLSKTEEGVVVRMVDPACICEPQDPRRVEGVEEFYGLPVGGDWRFGVHADRHDSSLVWGYYIQWSDDPQDWEYVPAERMVHIKTDCVDTGVKRGVSDFYAVEQYLQNAGKLDRNVGLGAAILSAIIGIRQHAKGVTQSQVQGYLNQNATWRQTVSTAAGYVQRNYQKVNPGSFIDMPGGTEYKGSPLANQGVGEAFVTIKQALLRTIGGTWCMPEYLISGDASNANYASTLVAESPFVKFCKMEQAWYGSYWVELYEKVLILLGTVVAADLRGRISVQITFPVVEARDRPQETNRRKVLHENKVIALSTWQAEEGYDSDDEAEKRKDDPKPEPLPNATPGAIPAGPWPSQAEQATPGGRDRSQEQSQNQGKEGK